VGDAGEDWARLPTAGDRPGHKLKVSRKMFGYEGQSFAGGGGSNAMARAIMLNPEVVLLDEPSMGLAPILVEEVFRIIERLKGEGVTMLLVEQFAAAALAVADYGYVLENGHIKVHGPAEKLRNDPAVKAAYLGGSH
jgi:ABC-type branched-subunit amino acid transport system ATPase component